MDRRRALVHFHCHQSATTDVDCDQQILDALGLDYEVLDSGCCGMAGSFGYEAGQRYDVSIAAGERVLLPAVRQAPPDALLVTDGFSCREQIAQATGRRAHHLAEVLALAALHRHAPYRPATRLMRHLPPVVADHRNANAARTAAERGTPTTAIVEASAAWTSPNAPAAAGST